MKVQSTNTRHATTLAVTLATSRDNIIRDESKSSEEEEEENVAHLRFLWQNRPAVPSLELVERAPPYRGAVR